MQPKSAISPAPVSGALSVGQVWPDLFIRHGRTLQQVTPEQAGRFMETAFQRCLREGERTPFVPLYDCDGKIIGHISPNGRTWLGPMDSTHIEIPQAGRQTAAQFEAELKARRNAH